MGCDIHTFVEKLDDNGDWEFCHSDDWDSSKFNGMCNGDRNYSLFGALAGVRREVPDSLPPKGFPNDASYHVKKVFDQGYGDWHTPSYISLVDALPIYNKYMPFPEESYRWFANPEQPTEEELVLFEIEFGFGFTYGVWFGNVNEKEIDKYHLVFWFDN